MFRVIPFSSSPTTDVVLSPPLIRGGWGGRYVALLYEIGISHPVEFLEQPEPWLGHD